MLLGDILVNFYATVKSNKAAVSDACHGVIINTKVNPKESKQEAFRKRKRGWTLKQYY